MHVSPEIVTGTQPLLLLLRGEGKQKKPDRHYLPACRLILLVILRVEKDMGERESQVPVKLVVNGKCAKTFPQDPSTLQPEGLRGYLGT